MNVGKRTAAGLLAAAVVAGAVLALGVTAIQGAPDTSIRQWALGSGGTTDASSTSYRVGATAGQPAIGRGVGGGFDLCAGFWCGSATVHELTCGYDGLAGTFRPERIDGAFAGVDDDGDALIDEALPAGAAGFDCDGDGYTGAAEAGTPLCSGGANDDGTGPMLDDAVANDGCPGGPAQVGIYSEAQFNITTTDQDPCGIPAWPSDFASGGIPNSTNRITLTDLTSFTAIPRKINTSPGNANYNQRWDLLPGRGILGQWINVNDLTALILGTTGFPAMFNGSRAFNGPTCPWP
jgi:hypothetical protein